MTTTSEQTDLWRRLPSETQRKEFKEAKHATCRFGPELMQAIIHRGPRFMEKKRLKTAGYLFKRLPFLASVRPLEAGRA